MSSSNGHSFVPKTVPSILKTYIKDAIRTQPYDLLSWSAAYFRCISNNIPTPAKIKFEETSEETVGERRLTKEYLRVLVKQIGHGYFVERAVLQDKWRSLSLPQDHLLAFLSLSGMLKWERVQWLELLPIMAASISNDFSSTMNLLCELLTVNPGDGLNSLPFWMFKSCFSFLAHFDCNLNGTGTKKTAMEPAQIYAQNLRVKLIDEWKACVRFDAKESSSSSISVAFDKIKRAMDFTEIIQVLSDMPEMNETSDDEIELKKDNVKWKYEIIRHIGAPWNWVFEFVDHCSPRSRSYNFYECQHKLNNMEYDEYFDVSNSVGNVDLSGAGPVVSTEITDAFLSFAKTKALENDGIISLKQIMDHENCPPMN